MSEEPQGTSTVASGQAPAEPTGTTAAAPAQRTGQPAGQQTTTPQTGTDAEDTFFDPRDLPEELKPAYRNMQRAWSKKTEALKSQRDKIEAYENWSKDPIGNLQRTAEQYGFKITPAQAAAAAQAQTTQDWQPQTWEDVLTMAEQRAETRLMDRFKPLIEEVTAMKKNTIEKVLDENCPDWRQHEDEMMSTLRKHPSLVNDPAGLYRLSVPQDVLESRATQRALRKLEEKAKGTQVAGTSTTTQRATPGPNRKMSFNEAVEYAKLKLAEDGIRP